MKLEDLRADIKYAVVSKNQLVKAEFLELVGTIFGKRARFVIRVDVADEGRILYTKNEVINVKARDIYPIAKEKEKTKNFK